MNRAMIIAALKALYQEDYRPARGLLASFRNESGDLDLVVTNAYLGVLRTELTAVQIDKLEEAIELLSLGRELLLTEQQLHLLEQVILAYVRPSFLVHNSGLEIPPQDYLWHTLHQHDDIIRRAVRKVGIVELPGHGHGSGFLVGSGLVMTAKHVIQSALSLDQARLTVPATIDFLKEHENPKQQKSMILGVALVHPRLDVALLYIEDVEGGDYFVFDSARPEENKKVITIGYPAEDLRDIRGRDHRNLQKQIFQDVFNVKRCAPGFLTGIHPSRWNCTTGANALTHDCSTLWGNSGGAVVDLDTGYCMGVHVCGYYLDANYCVPGYELATDRELREFGLMFR